MQGPAPSSPSSKESAVFMACFQGVERPSLSSTPTTHLSGNSSAAQMQTQDQTARLKRLHDMRHLRAAVFRLNPHKPNRISMGCAASRTYHGNPMPPTLGRMSKAQKFPRWMGKDDLQCPWWVLEMSHNSQYTVVHTYVAVSNLSRGLQILAQVPLCTDSSECFILRYVFANSPRKRSVTLVQQAEIHTQTTNRPRRAWQRIAAPCLPLCD